MCWDSRGPGVLVRRSGPSVPLVVAGEGVAMSNGPLPAWSRTSAATVPQLSRTYNDSDGSQAFPGSRQWSIVARSAAPAPPSMTVGCAVRRG